MYMRNGLKKFSSQGNELVKYVKSLTKQLPKILSKKIHKDIKHSVQVKIVFSYDKILRQILIGDTP